MNTEAVEALTHRVATAHLRSIDLAATARTTRGASQKLRFQHGLLTSSMLVMISQHAQDRLRRDIRRKLLGGLLPYESAARLFGGPGVGGTCRVCDRALLFSQLVMAVPMDGHFLDLHADCFLLWDDERRHAPRRVV